MHTKHLDFIEGYKTNNREIRYMFSINLGLNPSTNKVKKTTRRGFSTYTEAEAAYKQLRV